MSLSRATRSAICVLSIAVGLTTGTAVAGEFVCGDGRVDPPIESCDPPGSLTPNGEICRLECNYCGDGAVQPAFEACDDGNDVDGDGCETDCHVALHVEVEGNDETGDGSPEAPFASIQRAFAAAAEFTRILVGPGTYNECIRASFPVALDRPVKIVARAWESAGDNTATIISGAGICDGSLPVQLRAPVVRLASRASTLQGFTIRDGGSAGVRAAGSVVITNNVITDNVSTFGGGIYFYSGVTYYAGDTRTRITGNRIAGNLALRGLAPPGTGSPVGGNGGGIFAYVVGREGSLPTSGSSHVVIDGNTIEDNSVAQGAEDARIHGGGLGVFTTTTPGGLAEVVITNNVIRNNVAGDGVTGYGGGAWLYTYGYGTETITLAGNTVEGNRASVDGGGVSAWITTFGTRTDDDPEADSNTQHTIVVEDNLVQGNATDGNGGGLDLFLFARNLAGPERCSIAARNNVVRENHSAGTLGGGGGALATVQSWRSSTPGTGIELEGNTFRDNTSDRMGAGVGIWMMADSNPGDGSGLDPATAQADIAARGNLVVGNRVVEDSGVGGGVFAFLQALENSTSTLMLDRMTIADNDVRNGSGGVEIETFLDFDEPPASTASAEVRLYNSIVTGNGGTGVGGPEPGVESGILGYDPGNGKLNVEVRYSDVWSHPGGGYDTWMDDPTGRNGNLSEDPRFDAAWRPAACSPTLDAADPELDYSREAVPNGGRANMGHTGGTAAATPSLPDLNGDGSVDGIDIVDLSVAFGSSFGDPRYDARVDLDGDGRVNGVDLSFVAAGFRAVCR